MNKTAELYLPLRNLGHIFTAAELRTALTQCTESDLAALSLLWLTEGTPSGVAPWAYQVFRELIAEAAGVAPKEVSIVGSLRAGFSLSPAKFGVPPHSNSDLDALVVSESLFSQVSEKLLSGGVGPKVDLERVRKQADTYGFVDTKHFATLKRPEVVAKMHSCFIRLKHLSRLAFNPNRSDVRIYRSWQHASRQIVRNLAALRKSMADQTKANSP